MALVEPAFGDETEAAPEMDSAAFLSLALTGANLVEHVEEAKLASLAADVVRGYEIDEQSMEEWEAGATKGVELAAMLLQDKTYPWPDAANAKYPLIASACLQFNARAYPSIVPPDTPVKVKTYGADPEGVKAARAERVQEFLGHQLLGPVVNWEEGMDSLLLRLPAAGTVWRKTYYDPIKGLCTENRDRVVFNNYAQSIDRMPRISEEFGLYPHEIQSRIRSERFVRFEWIGMGGDLDEGDETGDDEQAPHYFIEQLRREDLDGDGYDEPYIVTLHRKTQKIVRIVANFGPNEVSQDETGQVLSIRPREFYVPYRFLPSFDGTFAGIGLGTLLGNTSELINSLINLILDSGHLSSLGGGFIGLGLNLKGGPMRIRPGEWKPVQAAGASVRDAMVPLQFPGPSAVLFQVLGLLIEAGKEVSSTQDIMTGDASRNQTATTTLALIEQGMAVFTAAYKRIFRALRKEFALICEINAETIDPGLYARFHDMPGVDPRQDFSLGDMDIGPVADPRAVTNMQRLGKAQLAMEMAQTGVLDPTAAARRVLEEAGIENVEDLLPQQDPQQALMAQAMTAMQAEMARLGLIRADLENQKIASEIEENRASAVNDLADAQLRREGEVQEMDGARFDRLLALIQTLSQVSNASQSGRPNRMAQPSGNGGAVPGIQSAGRAVQTPDLRAVLGLGGGQP